MFPNLQNKIARIFNFITRRFEKVKWYSSFYCDWCGFLDRGWHYVFINNNKKYIYHHIPGECLKPTDRKLLLDWVQRLFKIKNRLKAGKMLKNKLWAFDAEYRKLYQSNSRSI